MRISTDILWDYLKPMGDEAVVYNCIKRKAFFSSVRQHPNKAHEFAEKAVYIVGYEKYWVINKRSQQYEANTFIFVNDGTDPDFSPEDCHLNAIVIMNGSIMDIFTQISDIDVDFDNWSEEINNALIEDRPLKELVNIGQKFIINPFIILDEALNVIAFTDNINESDETFRATIQMGHTPATLITTIMEKRDAKRKDFTKESLYMDHAVVPFEEVNLPILIDGKVIAVMCIHCSVVESSEGAMDVIRYFADKLSYYFRRNRNREDKDSGSNELVEQFLGYVLRHDMDEQELGLMAEAAEFPCKANFTLYVIESADEGNFRYLYNRVQEYFLLEKGFVFENHIMLLSVYIWKNNPIEDHIRSLEKKMGTFMEEYNCTIGVSREFQHLIQLKAAYTQAQAAMRIGKRLEKNTNSMNQFGWNLRKEKELFRYEELALYHMLETCGKELPLKDICLPQIISMIRYDKEKGTDNYKILYTYLEKDMVASDTAELLHMHRNNVNYRLKRIREMFGIDLADHEERLRIQMSFRIIDLLDKNEI